MIYVAQLPTGAIKIPAVRAWVALAVLVGGTSCTPRPAGPASGPVAVAREEARYRIIETGGDRAKGVYYVRLGKKVDDRSLVEIAREIRLEESPGKRIVIWFYLPESDAFTGRQGRHGPPWAFAEFDPDLKVEIRGLTVEQEAELVARPIPSGRDVIGRWLMDSDGGSLCIIYRQDGMLYLETARPTGGGHGVEIVDVGTTAGRRFERKEPSRAGDHYLINDKGNLELRDGEGLIAVARPVAD